MLLLEKPAENAARSQIRRIQILQLHNVQQRRIELHKRVRRRHSGRRRYCRTTSRRGGRHLPAEPEEAHFRGSVLLSSTP